MGISFRMFQLFHWPDTKETGLFHLLHAASLHQERSMLGEDMRCFVQNDLGKEPARLHAPIARLPL
ncbi:hypothetical protein [Elioraea rosea]|uniref:hypothetical protein n=1 Tax=Elioraea rosea TaxID=2492390 RepID=UPI0013154388|nr:hypothetical protein [Elioraea rosea]